jgi:hypothetical protein
MNTPYGLHIPFVIAFFLFTVFLLLASGKRRPR